MDVRLDLSKIAPALDLAGALALFGARSYSAWVLWSLYVAAHLPFGLHAVELPVVAAALALVAVWRGLSWPSPGSVVASLQAAVLYAGVGLGAAWFAGAAPSVPVALGEVSDAVPSFDGGAP